jgi:predicted phosphodiesterase
MKILYLGDPHIQVGNLEDSELLLNFVLRTAQQEEVDKIVILGDLMHTHAILRVEVLNFWDRWLSILSANAPTIVLVGNHDLKNQKDPDSENGLSHFTKMSLDTYSNLTVVNKAQVIDGILYAPYMHDNETFINTVNGLADKSNVVVCHQSFDGSQYDNGFYDPEGIDSTLIKQEQIISGHIHGEATFGKVWHPGTAKWDTAADANKNKQIWVCEHDDKTGLLTKQTAFNTYDIVTPIISLTWTEGEPEPTLPERANTSIELIGGSSFVNRGKELFKGKAKLKTKITDRVVRENRKASASVLDFLDNVYKTGVNKDKLKTYLKEKNYV